MNKDINLSNRYRVLLTEVLPYELPLMLDNEGFYLNMQDEDLRKAFLETFKGHKKRWTIPFDYFIRKYGGEKSRKLSLMHPLTQLDCVQFYADYDHNMLSLCNNSPFSIRHITKCAKCIFKADEAETVDTDIQQKRVEVIDNEIEKQYRSYFSYTRYDMMYKFFTSGDYLRLEQKYTHLMKMDIASCFYHIYTHTIAWAVKGKKQAKDQIGKSTFENKFDTLMQCTNYNETNGIIVGPEISRIFAEIILQRIDVNVLNHLKQEPYSLKLGCDYEIRRYVDDHYIYANSVENLRLILDIYKAELQIFKLYVNESKLELLERPFVSDVSVAKQEMNELMSSISERWLVKDKEGRYKHILKNEMNTFSSIVTKFRTITHKYKQKYGALNRYFLMLLVSQISEESKNKNAVNVTTGLLLMYLEVAFYAFSLDMNVSASIKLCRILNELHNWAEKCVDRTILPDLENRIHREVKRCLDIYEVNQRKNETNIEVLNLMLCLSRMMRTSIPRVQLLRLFNISKGLSVEYKQQNYFQICTLLYIVGNDVTYEDVRKMISDEIKNRVKVKSAMSHADTAMLFFDTLVCPFLKKEEGMEILKIACGYKNATKAFQRLKIYNKTKRWFFNWDKTSDLSGLLSKKEYHHPYELYN